MGFQLSKYQKVLSFAAVLNENRRPFAFNCNRLKSIATRKNMIGQRNPRSSFANLTWIVFLLYLASMRCHAYFSGIAQISRNYHPKLDDDMTWESYVSSLKERDETFSNGESSDSEVTTKQEKEHLTSESTTHAIKNVSKYRCRKNS